jgi:hypothetical protein
MYVLQLLADFGMCFEAEGRFLPVSSVFAGITGVVGGLRWGVLCSTFNCRCVWCGAHIGWSMDGRIMSYVSQTLL